MFISFWFPTRTHLSFVLSADDLATATKIIKDLDRPKKLYRLTYTVSEMDGAKRVSSQRFTMMLADGQRVTLKQGSKVPIATGSVGSSPGTAQTQFQYLDVGMNFDATPLTSVASGAVLKTKVEQSSVAETATIAQVQEPVIRQTALRGRR